MEDVNKNIERSISDTLRWAMLMPTASGLLRGFRVEGEGENAGRFNIRTRGIDPLIASVRAFAASKGISEPSMLKCIFHLRMRRIISAEMERALTETYDCFMEFLLRQQECRESGNNGGWVDPSTLTRHEHAKMCKAMNTVEYFQKYIYEDSLKEKSGEQDQIQLQHATDPGV